MMLARNYYNMYSVAVDRMEAHMSALTNARKKAGLTQRDLADRLGLTQGAIAHYEADRRVPRLDICRRIVSALNDHGLECTLEEVFPETGQQKRAA